MAQCKIYSLHQYHSSHITHHNSTDCYSSNRQHFNCFHRYSVNILIYLKNFQSTYNSFLGPHISSISRSSFLLFPIVPLCQNKKPNTIHEWPTTGVAETKGLPMLMSEHTTTQEPVTFTINLCQKDTTYCYPSFSQNSACIHLSPVLATCETHTEYIKFITPIMLGDRHSHYVISWMAHLLHLS
jgi:hypothetical protein